MLNREDGKLEFNQAKAEIEIGDILHKCWTKEEVEWLKEQLKPIVKQLVDERIKNIERCRRS
ncbi:hypothetical protein [Inconstantimicrobium mannanitabidum]|uniref:Uncharacterized protein n=1 Tax=Inconstantimicrobium mannanitabidum TaxID=1604901 RepID=A0ACB5R9C9_9CLOT|nr:hypothetical protein [Clostridium sp. TW13]GKX65623.1 hypothetical protein rsdtw13_08810 [Clostridium sp. TW13]